MAKKRDRGFESNVVDLATKVRRKEESKHSERKYGEKGNGPTVRNLPSEKENRKGGP